MLTQPAKYEVVEDFPRICEKLIAENRCRYGHIDATWFRMTLVVDRAPPTTGKPYKVINISGPLSHFCSFRHVVVTWQKLWDEMGDGSRTLMVTEVLDGIRAD